MVVLLTKLKLPYLYGEQKRNEWRNNYTIRVVHVFTALLKSTIVHINIFGHALAVNNRCYGRC